MNLWLWLKTIEASIWVGLITSTATLAGITLTNVGTSGRLRKQFEEDRRRDEQKRLFESRRDIYTAAMEALSLGIASIGGLSDVETDVKEVLRPYTERAGNIAKVHLICSSEVSELLIEIGAEITTAIIDLTIERIDLDTLVQRRRGLSSTAASNDEEIVRIRNETLPLQISYAEHCVETATKLAPLVTDIILAIRADLGTPGYKSGYTPSFQKAAEQQLEHLREVFRKIRQAHLTPAS